jgi:hypothetical protein
MTLRATILGASMILGLAAIPATAATLDFTILGSGTIPANTASVPGANLGSGGDAFFVGANFTNSICALDSNAFSCANDLQIGFTSLVSNLSFSVGGWQQGDRIELSVFDAAFNVLESVTILSNGDPPPLKWSDLKYVFRHQGGSDHGKEEAYT